MTDPRLYLWVDPERGDVAIIDNDNVGVGGGDVFVWGTRRGGPVPGRANGRTSLRSAPGGGPTPANPPRTAGSGGAVATAWGSAIRRRPASTTRGPAHRD